MARPKPQPAISKAPRKSHPLAPDTPIPTTPAAAATPSRPDPKVGAGNTRLSTVVPADLYKQVKMLAVAEDVSIQAAVAEALAEWVAARQ